MSVLIEPFFYCLLTSVIWAPLVFIGASRLSARTSGSSQMAPLEGKIWPAALIIAALPAIIAPFAAALGLSLRSTAPLPPMALMTDPSVAASIASPVYNVAAATTVSLGDIIRAGAILYFYGFMMFLALGAIRHIWFAYRLNYAIEVDEPKFITQLEDWRMRIGVKRRPRYVFSHIVSSVCVYGFFRPVVVMPFNLLTRVSIDDASLMGAHEMAHIKRGDVALFALCSVAKAIFWFNPFMHRICARANLAAEQGADALVLASGVDRRQYAHCFVQGLRLASGARNPITGHFAGELVPSFTPFDKRSRRARLDAILSGTDAAAQGLDLKSKLMLGAGVAVAVALSFAQAAFAVTPAPAKDALTVTPVEGEISLPYGQKSEVLGKDRITHEGIDIRAPRGTPVRAAGDGKIIDATKRYQGNSAWGKVVVVDHGHGLVTRYAHLDSYLVRKGESVDAGDVIGAVGSTGRSTGPHLHFEVLQDGETIDPAPVMGSTPTRQSAPAMRKRSSRVIISPQPPLNASPPPSPTVAPAQETHIAEHIQLNEQQVRKLEKHLATLEGRLRERFKDFDAFSELDGMSVRFGEVELEGFKGAEELSELLGGKTLELRSLKGFEVALPDVSPHIAKAFAEARLNKEELQELKNAQVDVVREVNRAVEQARENLRADQKRRAKEQSRRERKIERERAKRDTQRARDDVRAEKAALARREEALKKAQAELARELIEIENRRAALERRKDDNSNE